MSDEHADYLGDGVYATFDGYHIWLKTGSHRDHEATDKIALEPAVFTALVAYQRRLVEKLAAAEEPKG